MLTQKQIDAAKMTAAGQLSQKTIAKAVGISDRQLRTWLQRPDVQFQIREFQGEWRTAVRANGIADQDRRIAHLNDRHELLMQVIRERAESPEMEKVPGGKSGLLTVTYKMLTRMEDDEKVSEPVPEYKVDTGTLAELRAIEQQVAIEMGQWKTKHEVEVRESHVSLALSTVLSEEQLRELIARMEALKPDADRHPE